MLWAADNDWAGETVVIVAGGPSLCLKQVRHIAIARAKETVRVIAINDAVYPCWFADVLWACDPPWWKHHEGVPGFPGRRVSFDPCGVPGVDHLIGTGTEGFDPTPGSIRSGGNSGYQAIHLSIHLGVERIILVGYDMHASGGTHWFGEHPDPVRRIFRNMSQRIMRFNDLVAPINEHGIEIVNCSPGSALKAFPMGSLESELKKQQDRKGRDEKAPSKDAKYHDRMVRPQNEDRSGYRTR